MPVLTDDEVGLGQPEILSDADVGISEPTETEKAAASLADTQKLIRDTTLIQQEQARKEGDRATSLYGLANAGDTAADILSRTRPDLVIKQARDLAQAGTRKLLDLIPGMPATPPNAVTPPVLPHEAVGAAREGVANLLQSQVPKYRENPIDVATGKTIDEMISSMAEPENVLGLGAATKYPELARPLFSAPMVADIPEAGRRLLESQNTPEAAANALQLAANVGFPLAIEHGLKTPPRMPPEAPAGKPRAIPFPEQAMADAAEAKRRADYIAEQKAALEAEQAPPAEVAPAIAPAPTPAEAKSPEAVTQGNRTTEQADAIGKAMDSVWEAGAHGNEMPTRAGLEKKAGFSFTDTEWEAIQKGHKAGQDFTVGEQPVSASEIQSKADEARDLAKQLREQGHVDRANVLNELADRLEAAIGKEQIAPVPEVTPKATEVTPEPPKPVEPPKKEGEVKSGLKTDTTSKSSPPTEKAPVAQAQAEVTRVAKTPAQMTAGEINKELDKLSKKSSELTDKFIAEGRGNERPSDYQKKTDPLSQAAVANSNRISELRNEIESRYGPNAPSRLPTRGFGPREKKEPPANPSVGPDAASTETPVEHKGLGAAAATENLGGGNDFVSNMFAAIDRDRAAMGKEPMPDTQRRSWDEDNQKALARMNRDPQWIPDLIKEVTDKPRPLLSWENAGMVWQRHLWKAEANNALARIAQAFDDGRTADLESAKLDAARFEDKLDALDKAVGRNGTGSEAGRSLQAQKMAAGEDFSLVEMRLQKRKANGGKPLTDAQAKEIQDLHDKLKSVEAREVEARQKLAASEVARVLAETRAQASQQPTYAPGVLAQAERFAKFMDKKGSDALARLKARGGRMSAGVDPTVLSDVAIYGASKITRGLVDKAKWIDSMAADVGEWIREHAEEFWTASQKELDDNLAGVAKAQGAAMADKVKKAVKDIPERIDAAKEKIQAKVSQGSNAIGGDVQALFRAIVEQDPNMTARQAADKMHAILQESMPDITWQETADAISGRGKFWRPSQEALAKRLRDLRTQLRLIGHSIDVEEKRPLPRTGMQRDPMSAEALAENKRLDDLKRKFGLVVTDPGTQLTGTTVHSALRARKTAITREIAELQKRLADKDFTPKSRRTLTPDPELANLQAQKATIVKQYRKGLLEDELKNRTRGQRIADALLRIRREFILSGISSIGKLGSYSAQEFALAPVKEAIGYGLSKLPGIRQIAERAPSEIGHGVQGLLGDYVDAFTKGIRDAKDTFKGESELKARFDPSIRADGEFKAFFGTLHQMEKSPLIRFNFERSFRRRMQFNADRGVDVSDMSVQQRIGAEAYQDALRGALINRNEVVNRVNRFVNSLAEKSKTTGREPTAGKVAKFVFQSELPVQHVPANYVARTAEYVFGLGSGTIKTINAFRRGIESLEPAEADQIMRHLKSGSIGSAAMLIGFLMPNLFGGLYVPGQKNKDNLKAGEIKLGPVTARYWATHEQALNAMQFGATLRKVSETKNKGLTAGAQAALWGLADEVPYARELSDFMKVHDPKQAGKLWEEKLKGYLIPQGVSQTAELMDMNDKWRTVKRTPHTLGQTLETGIPGLRQNVPTR